MTLAIGDGLSDSRLLDDCIEGSALAWRQLHRRYYPVALAFLRKLGVSDRDLEDATQEVFLQLFRYLPRFRREAELSTWLYRLCITQARRLRRRAKLAAVLTHLLSLGPSAVLPSSPTLPDDVARRRIEAALSNLSEAERTVFVLYEMEGLAGKEIAQIVSCPEASVWRRLHYARRTFCAALGENAPVQ